MSEIDTGSVESDVVKQSPFDLLEKDLTPAEARARHSEMKARIAQILERGILQDRFRTAQEGIDSDRHAVWVRYRQEDIAKYEALGGRLERRRSVGTNDGGDDLIRVGDLVLMTVTKEVWAIIQEMQREQTFNKLGASRREFRDAVPESTGDGGVVTIVRERRG